MRDHPASPVLEGFVRETLGCGCPAEVFRQVDEAPTDASRAAGIDRRIDIGGRLLIYLTKTSSAADTEHRLADWIAAGRAERDRLGMNRLRLVLVVDEPADARTQALQDAFARAIPDADDRVHLHIIDPASVPAELAPISPD